MKLRVVGIIGVALVVGLGASAWSETNSASSPAPAGTATKVDPKTDPNRMICRRVDVTGSNMPEHICKTRAEWDAKAERDDRETKDTLREAHISGCGPRGC